MSFVLPDHIDPWRAVRTGAVCAGRLPLSGMPRLRAALAGGPAAGDAAAHYRWRFGRDADGRGLLTGEIAATLPLICQRCLEVLALRVEARPRLLLHPAGDGVQPLADDYETLTVDASGLSLNQLIEDELLLAIPAIPRHAPGRCEPPGVTGQLPARDPTGDPPGPFAVLARRADELQTQSEKRDGRSTES